MKGSRAIRVSLFALNLIILTTAILSEPVMAQNESTELINVINELRASQGLQPYTVDPALMTLAQEHSAYQASIHKSTHEHKDGRTPGQIGVVENVAGGTLGYVTPWIVVYRIWVDYGHWSTMVGYSAGAIGVGVANDGVTVYYTLELKPSGSRLTVVAPFGTVFASTSAPTIASTSLITMTPRSDGSIIHVVGYGQTLWSIALAYGVKIEQLRAWNGIAETTSDIYAGQRLLVRPAGQISPPAPMITVITSSTNTPTPTGAKLEAQRRRQPIQRLPPPRC